MEEFQAILVMDKVRKFFAKGHKSDNKRYHVEQTSGQLEANLEAWFTEAQIQKFTKRYEESKKANIPQYRTDVRQVRAEWTLLFVAKENRAGNCDEMGTLSAYFAHKDYEVPFDRLYFAKITKPGDHGFCLVAREPLTTRKFGSVTAFTQTESAKTWLVIDPWLHVCCRASAYLWHADRKLEEWAGKGKRIRWEHGSVGTGWYEPNGEYKTCFAEAPVELILYSGS